MGIIPNVRLKDFPSAHLCNPSVPITSQLFGDDISQTIKDIDEGAKIGRKIQHGQGPYDRPYERRGRGRRSYRRLRARGRGMPMRGTYGASSGYQTYGASSGYQSNYPKNSQRPMRGRGTYKN